MPSFEYSLLDDQGKKHWYSESATSQIDLMDQLESRGIDFIQVRKSGFLNFNIASSKKERVKASKVKPRELIKLCIHLSVLIEAGVPLTQALKDYTLEISNPYFKQVIQDLYQRVTNGSSLSDGLMSYPTVFKDEFIYLVRAGERTGTLPNALKELKKYLEWQEKIRSEMRQATTYPKVVAVVVGIFVLYLFSSIVPGIAKILVDLEIDLPWMTRVVMAISDFILGYGILSLAVIIPIFLAHKYFYNNHPPYAYEVDGLKLKIPVMGNLSSLVLQARFVHNFSIIHRAGISILDNLDLCYKFVPNRIFQTAIQKVKDDIRDGRSLSESMRDTGVFSSLILRMVSVGESSGNLDESLLHATNYYDEEIPRILR